MRTLLCHGRHRGGVLRNHRGGVPRGVHGDEAVPIRTLLMHQTAARRAEVPKDCARLRHGRVRAVAVGEKKEEHLRGRVLVVAGNESVGEGRVRGHAPVVAKGDRVDHRYRVHQGEWEDCPTRLDRMPHGTLVQRRLGRGGRYHRFRGWRQSPRRELSD